MVRRDEKDLEGPEHRQRIVVRAEDQPRYYGEENRPFGFKVEPPHDLHGVKIECTCHATAKSPVSQYDIDPKLVGSEEALREIHERYHVVLENGTLTVNPAALTVTANNDSKTYGQTKTYGAGSMAFTSTGLQNAESIGSVTITASGGAAANEPVGSYTLTPSLAAGGTLTASNYAINYVSGTLTVTPATVTPSITARNKVYDGTTAATITRATLAGVIGADDVSLAVGAATFADANVGKGKTVTATELGLSGKDAGNYALSSQTATTTANITALTLTVSGIKASNKIYNGATAATLNTSGASLIGVLAADMGNVTLDSSGATGAFSAPNVGTGETVTVSGLILTGSAAGNYQLPTPQATATASIKPAPLTVTGITASDKPYDGTTAAKLDTSSAKLEGIVWEEDDVRLDTSAATGCFADTSVAADKPVAVSGLKIGGADAANYKLVQPTATANITPAPPDHLCKESSTLLWEQLRENLTSLGECLRRHDECEWLFHECEAGVSDVNRLLKCQASDGQAFDSVRAIYWKLSTAHALKRTPGECEGGLAKLRVSLENLCRLSPDLGGKKPPSACQELGTFENIHSTYRTLFEIAETGGRLQTLAGKLQKVIGEAGPHLAPGVSQRLNDPFAKAVIDAVSALNKATRDAETAAASCDPQEVTEAFEELGDSVAQLTFALGNFLCELGRIKCLAQPAFFDMLQREADEFGFLAATVVSAFGRLSLHATGLGKQLKALWLAMRTQATGALKQAFEKWRQRQLCPPSLCYDDATSALLKAIDNGVADSENFTLETSCCDEQKLNQHRRLVDKVTDEVERLYCKAKDTPEFDTCVLTSLGSLAMRLHAILGRGTADLANSLRTTIETWRETGQWLSDSKLRALEPSLRVAHQLRTIACIYRWLENKVRGSAICTEPAAWGSTPYGSGLGEGELVAELAYEDGTPFANRQVYLTSSTGDKYQALTDAKGQCRRSMPKGVYKLQAVEDGAGFAIYPVWISVL